MGIFHLDSFAREAACPAPLSSQSLSHLTTVCHLVFSGARLSKAHCCESDSAFVHDRPASPVDMLDPIRKRFVYGLLWPLWPACGQNRAGSYMPDPTSRIRFSSVFPKKAWITLCKTDPDPIWICLVRVWPNVSGLKASRFAGIIWSGFRQDATVSPLPVSHFQTRFHSSTDVPDTNVQNQHGSDLVLADCVRFWPNGSGPEASQCARITRSASGQRFPADQDRIEIGSGMFTGKIVLLQQIITLSCHR